MKNLRLHPCEVQNQLAINHREEKYLLVHWLLPEKQVVMQKIHFSSCFYVLFIPLKADAFCLQFLCLNKVLKIIFQARCTFEGLAKLFLYMYKTQWKFYIFPVNVKHQEISHPIPFLLDSGALDLHIRVIYCLFNK